MLRSLGESKKEVSLDWVFRLLENGSESFEAQVIPVTFDIFEHNQSVEGGFVYKSTSGKLTLRYSHAHKSAEIVLSLSKFYELSGVVTSLQKNHALVQLEQKTEQGFHFNEEIMITNALIVHKNNPQTALLTGQNRTDSFSFTLQITNWTDHYSCDLCVFLKTGETYSLRTGHISRIKHSTK